VVRRVQSARMAARVRTLRAGLIGEPFTGMGDFYVSPSDLRRHLGVETRPLHPKQFKALLASVSEQEIVREQEEDRKRFVVDPKVSAEAFRRSLRTGLALRKWVNKERLGAFSFNFLHANKASGLETVPFLEASKLMAAGVGYGGEGDLLTASLMAGLAAANPATSFTEMFCPDWRNGAVYLSHMGEMNWRLTASRPRLLEMDYRFAEAENPVYVAGRFKPGDILLVNLLPLEPLQEGGYRLLIAPATMLAVKSKDRMDRSVHGWFKPKLPLNEFLAEYSRRGGTHHLALSYDLPIPVVQTFAEMMGWQTVVIG
jgi:L-arabinose isomerase